MLAAYPRQSSAPREIGLSLAQSMSLPLIVSRVKCGELALLPTHPVRQAPVSAQELRREKDPQ